MTDQVCELVQEQFKGQFKGVNKSLEKHDERIDKLEYFKGGVEVEIKNLVDQLKSLVNMMKWFMGLAMTSLVGFFIWYIQGI